MLKALAITIAVMSPALTAAAPAMRPDPCQRAIAEMQEAQDAYARWAAQNCQGPGKKCTNSAQGARLLDWALAAQANQRRQCN